MLVVDVKLKYKGINYHTNVIIQKGTPEKQILQLAKKQIKKQ